MGKMRLYEKRLLDLENAFNKAVEGIWNLQGRLAKNPEAVEKSEVKMQLDLAIGLVRLLKEQSAFYARLGKQYDIASFHQEFVEELTARNPGLALSIIEELDRRWAK